MKTAIVSIGKSLLLVGLVILSALNFFYNWLNWKELLGVQSLVGFAYIFLSCYEYLSASYKASLPVKRYPYFTNSFFMYRALKIGIFFAFSALLFTSGNGVKYLFPV